MWATAGTEGPLQRGGGGGLHPCSGQREHPGRERSLLGARVGGRLRLNA